MDQESSSLYLAIMDHDVARVSSLLKLDVSLSAASNIPETPLDIACHYQGKQAKKIVDLLIAYGAETWNLNPPAFTACTWSDLKMVKHLLKRDPDAVLKHNDFGENIIHCAAKNFNHGARIIRYIFHKFGCRQLLQEKEEDGLEPQVVLPRLRCEILGLIALNGGNFGTKPSTKILPGFLQDCTKDHQNCPMRIAETALSKIGYEVNSKILLELDFHEAYNNCPKLLTRDVLEKLDRELEILAQENLFGNYSAYGFLISKRSTTNCYAKNEKKILRYLGAVELYFYEGLIREKLERSSKRLKLFIQSYDMFFVVIGTTLPSLIFDKISIYLNDTELNNIINVQVD